jgi:DNA ligase D-like protein (predicted 3'-phosphoesterase)
MAKSTLDKYNEKRVFDTTPEPTGEDEIDTGDEPIFAIHKHKYTKEVYYLHLESHGVLKTWKIPAGPSMDPTAEQFARRIEDYPLSYAEFEGYIPKDHYNSGAMMLWDKGTYSNINVKTRKTIQKDMKEGLIQVDLDGEKVKGGFELKKFKLTDEKWVLQKLEDEHTDKRLNITKSKPNSVKSGKSINEIK